jgi:hypothetical protein
VPRLLKAGVVEQEEGAIARHKDVKHISADTNQHQHRSVQASKREQYHQTTEAEETV